MALLRNLIPFERRPRAFGYFGSVMATAAAVGPLLGGELTARFGWRSVFVANIPVIVLAYWLIRITTRSEATNRAETGPEAPAFDLPGSVLLGVGLTFMVLAAQASNALTAAWAATGAAVVLAVFVWWERRVPEPVLDLGLFHERTFSSASLVIGLQNLAMYSLLFQLPIFFDQIRGVEADIVGRTIVAMMLAMIVCSPLGGRLSEIAGARATAFCGTLISIAGVYLISDFQALRSPTDAVIGLILMGAGLGLSSAPSQAAAMSAVGRTNAGMAGGAVSTARYVGGVIGISALGLLLAGEEAGVEAHGRATVVYGIALTVAALSALALPGRAAASDASTRSPPP